MSIPFDKEELENQAILDFTKLKENKFKKEGVEISEKIVETPSEENNKISNDIKSTIATARMYGVKEIKEFEKLTKDYCKAIEGMVLFGDVAHTINGICIEKLLKGFIEPTFKGQNPYGVPEYLFKETRKDMYKKLIKKYVENK